MRTISLIALAMAISACGSSTISYEELRKPALIWWQGNGLCNTARAVDAAGVVWAGHACEASIEFEHVVQASAGELADLWTLFDALPKSETYPTCPDNYVHTFTRAGSVDPLPAAPAPATAYTCGDSMANPDNVTGLPDPFRAMGEAFLSLGSRR